MAKCVKCEFEGTHSVLQVKPGTLSLFYEVWYCDACFAQTNYGLIYTKQQRITVPKVNARCSNIRHVLTSHSLKKSNKFIEEAFNKMENEKRCRAPKYTQHEQ